MKRFLNIVLVLAVALSVCVFSGCKSDLEAKKDSFKNAPEINFEEFDKDRVSDVQGAKEKYSKDSYTLIGYVSEITEEKSSKITYLLFSK